eukprot:450919_1
MSLMSNVYNAHKCRVCRVVQSDHFFTPCLHVAICGNCAQEYEKKGIKKCASCGQKIECIYGVCLILPSVNIKSVETWDKKDFLQWIKVLKQKEFFKGNKEDEAATMNHIITQQKYSGKELMHCNTQDSFMKL